jgi:hypothetical protein
MTPTTFEDRLLAELRAVVAARPTPNAATARPARRARRTRPTLAAGAVAATIAGVFVATGGDTAAPAYAVEKRSDGSVTVEIHSLRDAAGLQQKLAAAGIPAVVDYTPIRKMCREPRGRPASAGHPMTLGVGVREGRSATFTIPRGNVRPGETLVITSSVGSSASRLGVEIIDGPVAPCELVAAPPPAAPGQSTGGATSGPSFGAGGTSFSTHDARPDGSRIGPSTHTAP